MINKKQLFNRLKLLHAIFKRFDSAELAELEASASAGTTDIVGLPDGTIKTTDYLPFDPVSLAEATFRGSVASLTTLIQQSFPAGIFTPVITASENLITPIGLFGKYTGNKTTVGGIITVTSKFQVSCTNANTVCKLTLQTPLTTFFADEEAAQICGLPSIVVNSGDETIANTGAGWNKDLFANTGGNTIDFWFEVAQSAVEYILDVSYFYEIQ